MSVPILNSQIDFHDPNPKDVNREVNTERFVGEIVDVVTEESFNFIPENLEEQNQCKQPSTLLELPDEPCPVEASANPNEPLLEAHSDWNAMTKFSFIPSTEISQESTHVSSANSTNYDCDSGTLFPVDSLSPSTYKSLLESVDGSGRTLKMNVRNRAFFQEASSDDSRYGQYFLIFLSFQKLKKNCNTIIADCSKTITLFCLFSIQHNKSKI